MCVLHTVVEPPARLLLVGRTQLSKCCFVRCKTIGNDLFNLTVALHQFPEEIQSGALVSSLCDNNLQNLAFMIHGPPEAVSLAIDLHEDLVDVPLPLGVRPQLLNTFSSDLRGEHRTQAVPPVPHCLVAHIDPAFVQQVFHIPKRQWEPHIHHHRQADDLWARLEVAKGRSLSHAVTLGKPPARFKRGFV